MESFKRNVLVVDDNAVNREILCDILSESYNTFEASNGLEALEFLKEEKFFISAILLDIQMPIMNGFEFLEELSKFNIISRIPVIVTTALGDKESEKKCLELGAVDFVRKPYDSYVVLTRIKNSIILRESSVDLSLMSVEELTKFYQWSAFLKSGEILLKQNENSEFDIIVFRIFDYQSLVNKYGYDKATDYLKFLGNRILSLNEHELLISHFDLVSFAILAKKNPNITKTAMQSVKEFKEMLDKEAPIKDVKIKCAVIENVNHSDSVSLSCTKAFKLLDRIKSIYDKTFIEYSDEYKKEIDLATTIEENMKTALDEKQFKVYYQPKYFISNGKNTIAGAEALIRWIHPELGFMNPGVFIPLFERNGFITEVDLFMLNSVCADLRKWIDTKSTVFPISINISRVDFFRPNIAESLINIVDSYKIPHNLIHFEVTETAFSSKDKVVTDSIHMLHENGFLIELDDFGSGYSNFCSLQSLDLDIIKLDLSLIKNEDNKSGKNVINFAYNLMKMMNMKTVQEGVETKEQLDRVRALGCDYVQGYYFSKPLCREEFEIFVKNNFIKD